MRQLPKFRSVFKRWLCMPGEAAPGRHERGGEGRGRCRGHHWARAPPVVKVSWTVRTSTAGAGARVVALSLDLADPEAVDAAAAAAEEALGPADVWVNNAMATILAPTWQVTPQEFRRATEVTYLGAACG